MAKGIEQAQFGNPYGARALFERSLRLDFAPRQTYYHLATTQIRLEDLDSAQENLEKCFTRFTDETVYLSYANLTANARQFDRAKEAVALLLATQPKREISLFPGIDNMESWVGADRVAIHYNTIPGSNRSDGRPWDCLQFTSLARSGRGHSRTRSGSIPKAPYQRANLVPYTHRPDSVDSACA